MLTNPHLFVDIIIVMFSKVFPLVRGLPNQLSFFFSESRLILKREKEAKLAQKIK